MPSPLHGPPFALPGPLDQLGERWARLPPRLRVVLVLGVIVLAAMWQANELASVRAEWGGDAQTVWRATETVPGGEPATAAIEPIRLPRIAVPSTAVVGPVADGAVLSLPLVEGAILTTTHLSPVGPAVALPSDQRAVPIPVQREWGLEAGVVVDVWAAVDGVVAPEPLAAARPVLQLREEGSATVALVALAATDVSATTAALTRGTVLLTLVGG